jgi:L-iditol 2-dehydrogenase
MKIARFTGLRELEIGEVPEPKLDGRDKVLVRIDRVGVCGSDVHYYVHGRIGNQLVQYPATLGHECAGTIVACGSQVKRLQPGDRVAIDPAIVCGTCDQCRAGRINTCRKIQFMGVPGQAPGAVVGYYVLPAENCDVLPESLSLETGVLVEPLSIGLHAVRLAGPASGIAVLGSGPIGLSVLLCGKATAPATVYMTDLIDRRLDIARRCGADWTGNPGRDDVVASILRRQPGGLDVVFECSGDPACIDQAQQLLAPGGTLVIVGIPPTVEIAFDAHTMRTKELVFKACRRQKGCIAPVIELLDQGRIDAGPLLTHRFPLAEIRQAFELVAGYRDGVIKAVLDLSAAE